MTTDYAGPKKHLQGQRVSNRDRFDALATVHAELELAGVTIDIGQLDWAVSEVQNRLHEASLDRQYAEAQAKSKASLAQMSEALDDLRQNVTGQDFDDEEEAEREERRQYRAWRNDSGV